MPHPTPAANRLRTLRHRGEFDPQQLAEAVGVSIPGYLKLEASDRLYRGLTLYKLTKLAKALNVQPVDIFTDAPPAGGSALAPFIPLTHAVRAELLRRGGSQVAFEAETGCTLVDFMARPEAAWAWTVEGLRAVCSAVAIDWLAALPVTAHLKD